MNISTGGPHLLLFERDQQLTALLLSEFQLAGYECHTARTAVEVFDAIARFPIRLVLVNLAQAAAARREFWVALDTQRRGRGVQVFTFLCTNLAGYGPHDNDDRTQPTLVDMHVDGMLGLMNLVEAVRSRVPGTSISSNTNTQPRMPKTGAAIAQSTTTPSFAPQPATGFSPHSSPSAFAGSGTSHRAGMADLSEGQSSTQMPTIARPAAVPPVTTSNANGGTQQSYTDKIRAVLYPHQRSAVVPPTTLPIQENTYPRPHSANAPATVSTQEDQHSTLQQLANGQIHTDPPVQSESGLDQLSRMLQERQQANSESYNDTRSQATPTSTSYTQPVAQHSPTIQAEKEHSKRTGVSDSFSQTTASPVDELLTTQTLRASPIQDLPIEHHNGYAPENVRKNEGSTINGIQQRQGQVTATPLASMTLPMPPTTTSAQPAQNIHSPTAQTQSRSTPTAVSTPTPSPMIQRREEQPQPTPQSVPENDDIPTGPLAEQERVEEITEDDPQLLEQLPIATPELFQLREPEQNMMANSAMLLDIVQSLPPMPSPAQQTQAQTLQGRATRTLGSVLLEGHLVPQSRLEVAQNIQRMLRGVDLNYQLGEILLMFKLLTPDQLLAASLVSYGLITTQQIVALGHIRQELHSIGLEYDLENLLILFRILTPEQLREVRSSWQS